MLVMAAVADHSVVCDPDTAGERCKAWPDSIADGCHYCVPMAATSSVHGLGRWLMVARLCPHTIYGEY